MPKLRKSNHQTIDFEDEEECGRAGEKPGQRNAANARERARMRILSKAFSRLKTTLPWVPPDTKLSKLDTLRLATSYIAHLKTILTDENDSSPVVHPLNLTWPFTIQQQPSELPSRNPEAWPLEEHPVNSRSIIHVGLVPRKIDHSTVSSEPETEESSKRFRNHHFIDHHHHHHHYSDSLLNIG